MGNQTLPGRTGSGAPRRRSVAAAARAAAKRADVARRQPGVPAGPDDPAPAPPEEPAAPDNGERHRIGSRLLRRRQAADTPPEAAPEASENTETPARRTGPLGMVLALLVAAGLIASATLGWQYREAARTQQARTAALAEARAAAPVILSYDYRHLDRDFAAARAHLTGAFLSSYGKTTQTVVAPTATAYHGVVKATVAQPSNGGIPAASVVSASPDSAVVLLFVNQVTTSTRISGPRLDLDRVRMTLTRTTGGWKVSAVDAL